MRFLFRIFVLIFITVFSFNSLLAQPNKNSSVPPIQEKVYVQTDKPTYLCGEIIWFKGNVLDAANLHFIDLSKVLYVELLNNEGNPVLQTKVSLDSGRGAGSLVLPTSLSSGHYVLRAYTAWMKNFSADNFFQTIITIINTTSETENLTSTSSEQASMDFFPEGGNFINDIQNTLAFKIISANGKGMNASGVIVGQAGDTVANFQSQHLDMGKFSFTPKSGKNYTAIIQLNGVAQKFILPNAQNSGYAMQLNEESGNVKISISRSADLNNNTATIRLYQNGILVNNFPVSFSGQTGIVEIPNSVLKSGVNQFTLLNGTVPVGERLYFKSIDQKLNINAQTSGGVYINRGNVELNIAPTNLAPNATAYLSAGVYALDAITDNRLEDIYTSLWLRPYVRGIIENAGFYFSNQNGSKEAIDNLMLTQGWRKFVAPSTTNNSVLPEVSGHLITGRVVNAVTNQPAEGIFVFLSVPGKRIQTRVSVSNAQGLVYFPMKDFYAKNQLVIQTPEVIKNSYRVEIFSPFSDVKPDVKIGGLKFSEKELADLKRQHLNVQVNNSYHDLNKMEPLKIDSTPFYVTPFKSYHLSDYTRFTTMEEVMREYVAEVNVRKTGNQFRLKTYNDQGFKVRDMQAAEVVFDKDPLVFLDGIPVFDMNKIIEYDPLKVEKLDVVASRYRFGAYTADGVLSYTSYFGNLEGFNADDRDVVMDYEGMQPTRIFYSPKYSTNLEKENRLPDFRSVLYWNPNISISGNTKLSFYTGDLKGKFLVVVEGITSDGKVGTTTTMFEVK